MANGGLPRRIIKVRSYSCKLLKNPVPIHSVLPFNCLMTQARCLMSRSFERKILNWWGVKSFLGYTNDKHCVASCWKLTRNIWTKETQRLIADPVAGISATPYADNLRYFAVAIEGPADSPYEKGVFQLELFLPADYPMAPPKVRFLTKIYHPNVDKLGRICLDILKDKWSPALQIRTVLLSIQALLSAPNPDDPLDNNVAELWKTNEAEALRRAKDFTESFAMKSTSA